jgi:hypothetical protein
MMRNDTSAIDGRRRKRRAVVVYLPDRPWFHRELKIVARCLHEVCQDGTDLLVFGPPELQDNARDALAACGKPLRFFSYRGSDGGDYSYKYINSIEIFNIPEMRAVFLEYECILRSDTDVFLLPAFAAAWPEPGEIITGQGGYVNDELTRANLRRVAAEIGLTHVGLHNLGSTWYGRTEDILAVAAWTEQATYAALRSFPPDDKGVWPSWYAGVCLLYGSEIALNHWMHATGGQVRLDAARFDFPASSPDLLGMQCHAHCWHTDDPFSKFRFQAGYYGQADLCDLAGEGSVRAHCLRIALAACPELDREAAERAFPVHHPGRVIQDAALLALLRSAADSASGVFPIGEEAVLFHAARRRFFFLSQPGLDLWMRLAAAVPQPDDAIPPFQSAVPEVRLPDRPDGADPDYLIAGRPVRIHYGTPYYRELLGPLLAHLRVERQDDARFHLLINPDGTGHRVGWAGTPGVIATTPDELVDAVLTCLRAGASIPGMIPITGGLIEGARGTILALGADGRLLASLAGPYARLRATLGAAGAALRLTDDPALLGPGTLQLNPERFAVRALPPPLEADQLGLEAVIGHFPELKPRLVRAAAAVSLPEFLPLTGLVSFRPITAILLPPQFDAGPDRAGFKSVRPGRVLEHLMPPELTDEVAPAALRELFRRLGRTPCFQPCFESWHDAPGATLAFLG